MPRSIRALLAATLFTIVLAAAADVEAFALPTGAWTIIGNGFIGTLQINSVDAPGNLNATVYGNTMLGYYDAARNHITFLRQFGPNLNQIQYYTGSLHASSVVVGANCLFLLSGTLETYGFWASAVQNEYGWVAFQQVPCGP